MVLESEARRRRELVGFLGLLLVEKLRHEITVGLVGKRETELELPHQVEQEHVHFARIVLGRQDVGQVGEVQFAFPGRQNLGVEDAVDAAGDPVGVEHVGIAQPRVVFVVEGDAQVVQVAGERGLCRGIALAVVPADLLELLEREVALGHSR